MEKLKFHETIQYEVETVDEVDFIYKENAENVDKLAFIWLRISLEKTVMFTSAILKKSTKNKKHK